MVGRLTADEDVLSRPVSATRPAAVALEVESTRLIAPSPTHPLVPRPTRPEQPLLPVDAPTPGQPETHRGAG